MTDYIIKIINKYKSPSRLIDFKTFRNEFKELSNKELIERIHRLYPTVDEDTRIKFIILLNKLGDKHHFNTIENYFISDEDAEVRIEAAKLLAFNYQGKRAIKPLVWVIKKEDNLDVKFAALRLLVAFSYKEAFRDFIIETLKDLFKSKNARLKMEVIQSLGILEVKSACKDLIALLGRDLNLVALRAIQALGNIRCIRAVPFLVKYLGWESHDFWNISFNALIKILGEATEELLVNELDRLEGEPDNRKTLLLKKGLIKGLGEIGSRQQAPSLLKLVESEHISLRNEAKSALDKIDPQWRSRRSSTS